MAEHTLASNGHFHRSATLLAACLVSAAAVEALRWYLLRLYVLTIHTTSSHIGNTYGRRTRGKVQVANAVLAAAFHQPRPVTHVVVLVVSQAEGAAELILSVGAVAVVVKACKEPPAIFRVGKVTLARTDELLPRDRENLGRAVAWGCRRGPGTHLPAVVEHKATRTCILEHREVVHVLVEFGTPVEVGAVVGVAVVSLARTLVASV